MRCWHSQVIFVYALQRHGYARNVLNVDCPVTALSLSIQDTTRLCVGLATSASLLGSMTVEMLSCACTCTPPFCMYKQSAYVGWQAALLRSASAQRACTARKPTAGYPRASCTVPHHCWQQGHQRYWISP